MRHVLFRSYSERFFLISHKFSLGDTLLHWAVRYNIQSIIKIVCETPVFERSQLLQLRDNTGQTIFHLAASVLDANTFSRLLIFLNPAERKSILQTQDKLGRTPLHLAASRKDANPSEIVILLRIILHNVGDDKQRYLMLRDREGKTAFHNAIEHGLGKDCIEFLLNEAENPKACLMIRDNRGKTALHYLFYDDNWRSRLEKLQAVLNKMKSICESRDLAFQNIKALLSIQDEEGRTILHYAAMLASVGLLSMLLNEFRDENERIEFLKIQDRYGKTFLHYFCAMSQEVLGSFGNFARNTIYDFFQMVLSKVNDRDLFNLLNIQDQDLKTALYYAIFYLENRSLIISMLNVLSKEARKRYLTIKLDEKGNTLFHYLAWANKDVLLIELLELIDERDRQELLEMENNDNITVLHYLESFGIKAVNLRRLLQILPDAAFKDFVEYKLEKSIC